MPHFLFENRTQIFYTFRNYNLGGEAQWLFSAKANSKEHVSAVEDSLATSKLSTYCIKNVFF